DLAITHDVEDSGTAPGPLVGVIDDVRRGRQVQFAQHVRPADEYVHALDGGTDPAAGRGGEVATAQVLLRCLGVFRRGRDDRTGDGVLTVSFRGRGRGQQLSGGHTRRGG